MWYVGGVILLLYIFIFIYKTKTGSPSVWSTDDHIKRMLAYVKPGMRVADLGCGDGRVLIAAVRMGAEKAEGWEIEPLVWLQAKLAVRREESDIQKRTIIHFGDMWRADLSHYDLVYVYQLTRYAPRFVAKCTREMKKGSLVVANTYPLDGLTLSKRDKELFVYMI